MSVINATPLLAAAGGDYQIQRSVRLRSSASAFFSRTPSVAGNQQRWTWSGWVKRGALGTDMTLFSTSTNGTTFLEIVFANSGTGSLQVDQYNGTSRDFLYISNGVYRDPSAWYHIVVAVDTTQATAANRVLTWVNGAQITSWSTASAPTQNLNTYFNATNAHALGRRNISSPSQYFDGYLTEVNFIDGQALTPSSFGETDPVTGVWKPRRYTGTYGTNGFYLNFSDPSAATAAAIGKDYSGNGNNWTPSGVSVTAGVTYDSMLDVPTLWADGGNGRGNYAVLNPLQSRSAPSRANLEFSQPNAGHGPTVGTVAMTSGKWYWEVEVTTFNSALSSIHIGIVGDGYSFASGNYIGNTSTSYAYRHSALKYNNASASAYGGVYGAGNVIGVALDLDAGTLTFYLNNVSQGTAYSGLSGTFYPGISIEQSGSTSTVQANFGQRPFAYTPPSGFKALNTQNLPEPTIRKPNAWMDATTYTGTSATRSVTNSGAMQPDLVWVKGRNTTQWHGLYNSVVGVGKYLVSNSTNAEATYPDTLTAFNSNGFSTGDDSSGSGINTTGINYVAWQWKEGATPGFDIVTYTGTGVSRTVAHSLGVAPAMMIVKKRNTATGSTWAVYHQRLANPATDYLRLELTNASATAATVFGATPTSSAFTVGTDSATNGNADTFVAYLFSEVAGFSRFGSYTGNGSTDGPFVFCGFRPRYILTKRTDSTSDWMVYDTARATFNVGNQTLGANLALAESSFASTNFFDVLSNGFKLRQDNASGYNNASGGTYIFAAFAENPFKYALAR